MSDGYDGLMAKHSIPEFLLKWTQGWHSRANLIPPPEWLFRVTEYVQEALK